MQKWHFKIATNHWHSSFKWPFVLTIVVMQRVLLEKFRGNQQTAM